MSNTDSKVYVPELTEAAAFMIMVNTAIASRHGTGTAETVAAARQAWLDTVKRNQARASSSATAH